MIQELKYVKMLVSDTGVKWVEREVLGRISGTEYPIVCKGILSVSINYRYAKPLPEPQETPPEGYRLVTDEERKKYRFPRDSYYIFKDKKEWHKCVGLVGDRMNGHGYAQAVPINFSFEARKVTMAEVCEKFGCEVVIEKEMK